MGLSWSHNLGCEFCRLARLNHVFCHLLIEYFFFTFILQYWVDWKLDFYKFIWFDFYGVISVSWLRFDRLTRVDSAHFVYFLFYFIQFNPSIFGWLRIELYFFILFSFYRVITVSWPGSRVRLINIGSFYLFFRWIFFQSHLQCQVN